MLPPCGVRHIELAYQVCNDPVMHIGGSTAEDAVPRPAGPSGMLLIEARDLNDAIRIASRVPFADGGVVEVRPVRALQPGAAAGAAASAAAGAAGQDEENA
ncbi:MAG: YciI family protein [Alcanivorax sp.]|nr:YciI family protein [Alcanivorax sp.]